MCAPLASRKLLIRTDYIHKKERGKRSHLGYPLARQDLSLWQVKFNTVGQYSMTLRPKDWG